MSHVEHSYVGQWILLANLDTSELLYLLVLEEIDIENSRKDFGWNNYLISLELALNKGIVTI